MDRHIAFITYETPYAPGGGIAAVMAHLPQAVQAVSNVPAFVITPFHFKIEKTMHLESEMDIISSISIDFDTKQYEVEVNQYNDIINWIFLKPRYPESESIRFFAGERHPYDLPARESNDQSNLLRDSLFFGKAAYAAMTKICPECKWTVFLQDWESATFALFASQYKTNNIIQSTYLTLHNSYDSGFNLAVLAEAGLDGQQNLGDTVLDAASNDPETGGSRSLPKYQTWEAARWLGSGGRRSRSVSPAWPI